MSGASCIEDICGSQLSVNWYFGCHYWSVFFFFPGQWYRETGWGIMSQTEESGTTWW